MKKKSWSQSNHARFKFCFCCEWYLWCISVSMEWVVHYRILDYWSTNQFYYSIQFYNTGALSLGNIFNLHFSIGRVMSIISRVFSFLLYMKGGLVSFSFSFDDICIYIYIHFSPFLFKFSLFMVFIELYIFLYSPVLITYLLPSPMTTTFSIYSGDLVFFFFLFKSMYVSCWVLFVVYVLWSCVFSFLYV